MAYVDFEGRNHEYCMRCSSMVWWVCERAGALMSDGLCSCCSARCGRGLAAFRRQSNARLCDPPVLTEAHAFTDVDSGSCVRENTGVLRRRRMAFSRASCSSPLAPGSPLGAHQKSRQLRVSYASSTRLTSRFSCYDSRANGDLTARSNMILAVIDRFTVSRSQGQ